MTDQESRMGFEENSRPTPESGSPDKAKTFFGLELSDGVVYSVVIILTVIFIRQVSIVIQALN